MKLENLKNKLDHVTAEIETVSQQLKTAKSEADQAIITASVNDFEIVTEKNSALISVIQSKFDTLVRAQDAVKTAITNEKEEIEATARQAYIAKRKQAVHKLDGNLKKVQSKMQEAGALITDIVADIDLIALPVSTQQHRRVLAYLCVANILEPAGCQLPELFSFKGLPNPIVYPIDEVLSKVV